MSDTLFLAWRYLVFNRKKTITLVSVITVVTFLPFALEIVLDRSGERLTARAVATPLLLGTKGSALELVLNSLYFDGSTPPSLPFSAVKTFDSEDLAQPVPIYVRYDAGGQPVVGTHSGYFKHRKLNIDTGRVSQMLGDAMLGALAARKLGLAPGDTLVTSPETVFNVSGAYPLKLHIAGVFAPTGTADDEAVFVDLNTMWVIDGIGHGHDGGGNAGLESTTGDGNTAVQAARDSTAKYREITAKNLVDFHFHGDSGSYPVTAVLVIPHDEKAGVLLEGRYDTDANDLQLVRPSEVMERLLSTVLTVRQYILAAVLLVGTSTAATIGLVFILSARLRRNEILTMTRIGASPGRVALILGVEVVIVFAVALAFASALTAVAAIFGDEMLRLFFTMK
jgi:putative ABC transport system permease protein